jgi:peptidoglycan/xylan/chitin deacetylase (PgdA/CDA1 family)
MSRERPLPWIPILMYHRVIPRISEPDSSGNCITVRSFRGQLHWLRSLGYDSVSLDTIAAVAADPERRRDLPRRPLVITFDDGYQDNHDHAWPILAEFGFSATIFLVSGAIGGDNAFDRSFTREHVPMLSVDQIQAMHRAGVGFGSHTRSHPHNMVQLPSEVVADELGRSRREIEAVVQSPVRHFSYPYTKTDAHLEEQVRVSGYRSACAGVGTPFTMFRLSRVSASRWYGAALLAEMAVRRGKHLVRRAIPSPEMRLPDRGFSVK